MAYKEHIDNYVAQFKSKGFTEEGLHIDKEPRSIEQMFRRGCDEYLRDAKSKGKDVAFVFIIPGVFKQDEPEFRFLFIVDPKKDTLELKKGFTALDSTLHTIYPLREVKYTPAELYDMAVHKRTQDLQKNLQQSAEQTQHKKKSL